MNILETRRLRLRVFELNDFDAMTSINKDPLVMKYFPSTLDFKQTKELVERIIEHHKRYGFSLYAVEIKSTNEMIGFVGLLHRTREEFDSSFMPATEIAWRLSSRHWNCGFATEAALAVLDYAFNEIELDEIVSFTTTKNLASRRIMEKIGLQYNSADDFLHPALEKNSPLRQHVLYRLSKKEYLKNLK